MEDIQRNGFLRPGVPNPPGLWPVQKRTMCAVLLVRAAGRQECSSMYASSRRTCPLLAQMELPAPARPLLTRNHPLSPTSAPPSVCTTGRVGERCLRQLHTWEQKLLHCKLHLAIGGGGGESNLDLFFKLKFNCPFTLEQNFLPIM